VLGVQPQLGRVFQLQDDDAPGRDAVAVLAPDFWRRELSADPAIVGRTIRLNGTEFTVIGVAQDSFTGLLTYNRADFYVPLAMTRPAAMPSPCWRRTSGAASCRPIRQSSAARSA
jgi:hypothetical protein